TGILAHEYFAENEYFAIVLRDSDGTIINEASVKGDENANVFATDLNETPFQYGYTITARFAEKGRFLVSNYPTDGATYKSPDDNPKTFIITNEGLVTSLLKNTITFLGLSNKLIATIEFDLVLKQLIVKSTGTTAHTGFKDNKYFSIVLKDTSGNIINEASVKGTENANSFATTLNETSLQINYTITVWFAEKDRFLVSNYPTDGATYKSPDGNAKTFTITAKGLVLNP
ncbi:MAG: putative mucin/carbohydrate-binding domain-containing protein, partial [Sarcina sp.]